MIEGVSGGQMGDESDADLRETTRARDPAVDTDFGSTFCAIDFRVLIQVWWRSVLENLPGADRVERPRWGTEVGDASQAPLLAAGRWYRVIRVCPVLMSRPSATSA